MHNQTKVLAESQPNRGAADAVQGGTNWVQKKQYDRLRPVDAVVPAAIMCG